MNETELNPEEQQEKPRIRKSIAVFCALAVAASIIFALVVSFLPADEPDTSLTAQEYYNLGMETYDGGNYSGAVYYFSQSISLNPDSAFTYVWRGDAYFRLGEMDNALADFNQSIELEPDNAVFYRSRGIVYYYMGEMETALADFNQSIAVDPEYAHAYYWRAKVYYQSGEMDQALADLDQSIQFDSAYAYAYHYRGMVYRALGDTEQAIADFQTCLTLNPEDDVREEVEGYLQELGAAP
ncbi:MAG: tetratricopeptide repeat protein [Dehalococcoidia bacterium]|jgi:tetratricopeptide (TPR) repeat protein